MGAATLGGMRMRPRWGLVNVRERSGMGCHRREMRSTKGRTPGFWFGSKTRRHKGGCAKRDERVGSGCGNRLGYQLTV